MTNDTQAGSVSPVIASEVAAVAANIKQMGARDTYMPFVDQALNRWHRDYYLDRRESARLVAAELEKIGTDTAVLDEFRRTYVGG